VRNLHRLFAVSPRWYNRSKHNQSGVTIVRYKHATPRRDIHMVDLRNASRRLHRLVTSSANAQLVGGVKLETAAKVAGAVTLAGLSANYLYNYHNPHVSRSPHPTPPTPPTPQMPLTEVQELQQELNSNCLKHLKKVIGIQNTGTSGDRQRVRVNCVPMFNETKLTKNKIIGEGRYGKIYSVVENNFVVVKEQTALCYPFYNEIDCLYALQKTGIVPILYDAYICSDPPVRNATENSQIKYGFVMQKLDMSLVDFINEMDDDTLGERLLDDIADKLNFIFETLDKKKIYHRDLSLANFMITHSSPDSSDVKHIYVIDFGHATSTNWDIDRFKFAGKVYDNPMEGVTLIRNYDVFVQFQIKNYNACQNESQTNKTLCKKPLIALRLAERILKLNKTADNTSIWQSYARNIEKSIIDVINKQRR
jgi:tRNA A-37 threonylcarbamoyl transferase component Bud32